MRIYAVADIHGNIEKIKRIQSVISEESPDIIVMAGDLTNFVSPLKTFDRIKDISIPVLGIRGNSDLKRVEDILKKRKNTFCLSPAPVTFQSFQFIGLNGTIPLPFFSKICFRENHCLGMLSSFITPETILVVHPPPRGVCDKMGNKFSAGSFNLNQWIKKHRPLMVLCGHIHEQAGFQFLKHSLVVNCAMNKTCSGAIIDCDKNIPATVKMILNNKKKGSQHV